MNTTTSEIEETNTSMLNGVDVQALKETITYLGENPEMAQFKFRARNRWIDGSRNETSIDEFHALGEDHERAKTHVVNVDQPALILGQDTAPNPVELLLAALSSCITSTAVLHAGAEGVSIDKLSSEIEGSMNLEGYMGIDPEVRPGYNEIVLKLKARSSADSDRLMELVSKSPVLDVLRNGTRVKIDIETNE
jgi:uncharacterized OsmC-like protein